MAGIKDINRLSQAELALLWGVSTRTIQRKPELETLRHGTGPGCYYVWAECRAHEMASVSQSKAGGDGITDKERQQRAEADLAEMERDERAGNLLDATETRRTWEDAMGRLRSNLRGFPARLLRRVDGIADPRERLELGNREMDMTLLEVSQVLDGEVEE